MKQQQANEEQLIYARILDGGVRIGVVILVITFAIYVFEIITSHIPVNELPKYWGLPVHEYLATCKISTGWSWLGMLGKGDFVNFMGIAFLAGMTIVCYVAVTPVFYRKKDSAFFILSLAEIGVLILAASGILGGGGH